MTTLKELKSHQQQQWKWVPKSIQKAPQSLGLEMNQRLQNPSHKGKAKLEEKLTMVDTTSMIKFISIFLSPYICRANSLCNEYTKKLR